ncbi:alpha 1A adrenergic receptor [Echinococcus multilocularis]|uniref:Alpha 1A adrenergic receptor n=1 Tax=Echinococcus multilocularis TaxID=6211 RepID=A0A068YAI1_ECHMU|nr:alpha 1A adrenergic receptor [Echinococcus multilocularis]
MSTNGTEVSLSNDLPRLLKCSVGVVVTFGIIFANLIIIIALLHSRKYLSRQTRSFLLNVALVDFLTGICIVPPLTVVEISNNANSYAKFFYLYWLTVGGLLVNARVLALVVVALDRYLAICHPIRYPDLLAFSRARLSLMLSWGLAFAMALPQLVVFSTELGQQPQNTTEITHQPHDWTYTTSPVLRGILVFMFFLRFVFPLTLMLVISILAFRVAIESNEGFRNGVLKVKEPDVQTNNEEKPPKSANHPHRRHGLAPNKITLMRIHRGNYMAEGTKDLFAQLPGTHRSLSRRTALLPNVSLGGSRSSGHPFDSSRSLLRTTSAPTHSKVQETSKENTSGTSTARKAAHSDVSLTPDSERTGESENTSTESQSHQRVAWWRSTRSHTPSFGFKFPHKKLKDLGSMIPFTTLLVALLIFSLPYQILRVLKALWFPLDLPNEVYAHLFWLACTNALINPVILTFWSSACRAKVLHLISCGRFRHNQAAIKRLIIASFGTANLPYGRQVHPQMLSD